MYESKADLYNVCLRNQDTAKACDAGRIRLDEQLRTDFIEPVSKYLGQYKDIKHRLDQEDTRRVDMDRYSRDVRTSQEKNKGQGSVNQKEQKYETAKTNYQNLHDELGRDLPLLYEDRIPFFDPGFATYLTLLSQYYASLAKSTAEVSAMVQHVNRSAIHDHPRVTTPPDQSSASHRVSSPGSDRKPQTQPQTTFAPPPNLSEPQKTSFETQKTSYDTNSSSSSTTGHSNPVPQATARPMPILPTNKSVPTPPSKGVKAQALFDFNAQESNELPFKVGDIITIVKQSGEWWEGELNGQKGLLPSNYVKLM